MNPFDQALSYVHDALASRRADDGPGLRASLLSLQRLAEVEARSTPLPRSAPAPERKTGAAPARPIPSPESAEPTESTGPTQPVESVGQGGSKAERLERLRQQVIACMKCEHLAASRTQVVFGVGDPDAQLMFVGEAPGADEDREGEPFVGKAGQLLTKIIGAMGLRREEVYIANVLKCRPDMPPGASGNRKPTPAEMAVCLPYLAEQIEIIAPKCLVALGATAMEGLLNEAAPMHALRGRWHAFKGIPLMATYHPAYLLRNQSNTEKRKVWEDMLQVMELLGMPVSAKQRGYFLPG